VMETVTARALRPLLNRWLGGFDSKEDRATDGGEAARQLWNTLKMGALVQFAKEEGGRPLVGKVSQIQADSCTVTCLDFWLRAAVERPVPRALVTEVLRPGTGPGSGGKMVVEVEPKSLVWCGYTSM
ncbi:unnamed protein product, partial [Polarella glacialis]